MLHVKTPEEVLALIDQEFAPLGAAETVSLTAAMGRVRDTSYTPDPAAHTAYDKLYGEYELLHDYFGRGANDVMKRLRTL
jgi:L-ribulokinase